MKYTVVQHSARGYKGDGTFKQGLETRALSPADEKRVIAAGGLVFNSYIEAEDYCEEEQYPPGSSLIPNAPGHFSKCQVSGLFVYVPVNKEA